MGVQRFVEHKIQLLELKGLEEFLKKHHTSQVDDGRVHQHNRVGKDQYADIILLTRNVVMLVLEGGISVPVVKSNEDIEMTD